MSTDKPSMFVTADGRNVLFTFILVSSLFLLWGFCNGMIDVMDKHFQEELHLTLAQSAWVQFAHYLGYFLMSLPAGWLATRLGYKGGIIAGLLMVALGGFWFIPATKIAAFWAFLVGVCAIASGLTFLETVANPYTTVLGPPRYAATRINLAQSCNGIGWILGPIAGGLFFYSKDAAGKSTGAATLWIPYAGVAVVVILLAVVFYYASVPDIKTEDDYHLEDSDANGARTATPDRGVERGPVYALLVFNAAVLIGICGMILWLVLSVFKIEPSTLQMAVGAAVLLVIVAVLLVSTARNITHHSMWSHPHFSAATLAQFFYVAAQAGIFSFIINYMTAEVPPIPSSWHNETTKELIEIRTAFTAKDIKDLPAFAARLKQPPDGVSAFVATNLSSGTLDALAQYQGAASHPHALRLVLLQDLNAIVRNHTVYDPTRFEGITLGESTRELLALDDKQPNRPRLNRLLLSDAFPKELAFTDGIYGISNKGASNLASLGFVCFLIGRFTGAGLLRKFSAHKVLGLYGLLNVLITFLVFLKLGWLSVVCVFLSYFFMSIMFPTIFALGIFGLGVRAKRASAYIVMAIMGGAILPKLMGAVADRYDMSRSFIVPMLCFIGIALYGYYWPSLSKAESLHGVGASGGH
ncbi:MAG: MFS transporter [Verrucomicrobia bacterium]|nr:MFS transporter [Verrucomicrobiota bacterium]